MIRLKGIGRDRRVQNFELIHEEFCINSNKCVCIKKKFKKSEVLKDRSGKKTIKIIDRRYPKTISVFWGRKTGKLSDAVLKVVLIQKAIKNKTIMVVSDNKNKKR